MWNRPLNINFYQIVISKRLTKVSAECIINIIMLVKWWLFQVSKHQYDWLSFDNSLVVKCHRKQINFRHDMVKRCYTSMLLRSWAMSRFYTHEANEHWEKLMNKKNWRCVCVCVVQLLCAKTRIPPEFIMRTCTNDIFVDFSRLLF